MRISGHARILSVVASLAATLSLGLISPSPANATTQLNVQGATVTWDETKMYAPLGCSRYEFSYANNVGFRLLSLEMDIVDQYGSSIEWQSEIGINNGVTGTWSSQICDFDLTAGNGPYEIKLTIGDYSSNTRSSSTTFTFLTRPPIVTSIDKASGAIGSRVILLGTNLANATSVSFNGVSAAFTASTFIGKDTLTATVPDGASTGEIQVTNPGGTVNAGVFTVLPPATTGTPASSTTPASSSSGYESALMNKTNYSKKQLNTWLKSVVEIPAKAKVSLTIAKSSKKVCSTTGTNIKTIKAGKCNVTFVIQGPKKNGKAPKPTKVKVLFKVG